MSRRVREVALDVLRSLDLTRIFANPGSTEVSFLTDLPDDFSFVLGLHEGSVVGMASGWAIGRNRPALVNLHTVAGLGNAVGALVTARQNRVPLLVVVGQQDRRHLALEPFLSGDARDLAGPYPVWVGEPQRAEDVPGALLRAHHEAVGARGPALVVVPMDDWDVEMAEPPVLSGPAQVIRSQATDPVAIEEIASRVDAAASPVLVVGAGADHPDTWDALVRLAERLQVPVWQEPFGSRAAFPQDHRLFAGHLPAARPELRAALEGHDLVLAIGCPVFRQYPFREGPLRPAGSTVVLITDDSAELNRSSADLAVHAALPAACAALADRVAERNRTRAPSRSKPSVSSDGRESLTVADVFIAIGARLPRDAIVVEETPSSRPLLHDAVPVRAPLGFVSAAGGGLGFGLPASMGLRMACPRRPVVALLGDGSTLYNIHALWSAAHYGIGVLGVVLANGRYAILDRLVEGYRPGGKAPWPSFPEIDVTALAAGFGCPSLRVKTRPELVGVLDEVLPGLAERTEPLLLTVDVPPVAGYRP